ncbi:MAG: hypothetical protein NTX25_14670, partial [Proteobacteria bacterium]|nr:hypothetical protein [Pseudomonadota bacterium]
MSSLQSLEFRLSEHRLEYDALCEYHKNIHLLIRQASAGLLFESAREDFFKAQVLPIIDKLLHQLTQTYGTENPRVQAMSSQALCSAIQELGD